MREILFRGQTRKNGEKVNMGTGEKVPVHWVYGGIFPGTGDYSIIYGGEILNDETVTDLHQMTNADRIRAMSDEELAAFLSEFKDCGGGCLVGKGIKDCYGLCATANTLKIWLQQPAEEADNV